MPRKRPPKLGRWSTKAQLVLPARRDELELVVLVDADTFGVVALEVPRVSGGASPYAAAAAVFGSHAHQFVGMGQSLPEAIALAEDYARAWLEPVIAPLERCACGEIAANG